MMQMPQANHGNVVAFPESPIHPGPYLSPAAMAGHLRRTNPVNARCFALAMHEDAAWANEDWGRFWADVLRLV